MSTATYTRTGTVKNSYSALGRSAYVLWDDDDSGIGYPFPSNLATGGEEFGDGARITVTLDVVEDKPAAPNPYRCVDCGWTAAHARDCPRHSQNRTEGADH